MEQTREAITQTLAERLCWQAARRLYRKPMVDGVYRLDERALLADFFHCLRKLGVLDLMEAFQGRALQRELVPVVRYLLLYGVKTLFGIESMKALPALLCSDEALMPLVGCNAQQVRHGVCQRGAAASTYRGAHVSGYPGTQHGAAESAGLGGLVQRHHSGPG